MVAAVVFFRFKPDFFSAAFFTAKISIFLNQSFLKIWECGSDVLACSFNLIPDKIFFCSSQPDYTGADIHKSSHRRKTQKAIYTFCRDFITVEDGLKWITN